MNLELIEVKNASDPKKECVVLKANADINLGVYAIVDKTFDEKAKASNEFRHVFFFPSWEVKKGDSVKLFTGKQVNYSENEEDGTETHCLFWNSKGPVWNNNGEDVATLIEYRFRDDFKAPKVKK